jgi:hypothetical protein
LRNLEIEAGETGNGLAESVAEVESVSTGLIVRHTSRRLGALAPEEARERLISGSISFAEFVDQVGDGFRELLEFMTENDLHPGRPGEVLYCIERNSHTSGRRDLRTQLKHLYASQAPEHRRG